MGMKSKLAKFAVTMAVATFMVGGTTMVASAEEAGSYYYDYETGAMIWCGGYDASYDGGYYDGYYHEEYHDDYNNGYHHEEPSHNSNSGHHGGSGHHSGHH